MKGFRFIAKVLIVFYSVLLFGFMPVYADTSNELLQNPSFTVNKVYWSLCQEGTAKVSGVRDTAIYDSAPASYRVDCISKGNIFSDAQFYTTSLKVEVGKKYKLTFRAKSEDGIANPTIYLMKSCKPWNSYAPCKTVTIAGDWATQEIYFILNTTDYNARLTFF
ncbi:carbohydrate binding domain-containing protein [Pseudobacteroides cellulosolvens]|uniref:Carbohydrate-binding CenC domain protein n=1 Tax=Pseudobacteroides cellulosolvens ATCC 35603 = DSM 2933 TaxID=398512 RepID=A0A0L6JLD8_9FIRM|nr:carbohydrate binding domain-containing protein [Pseudobacteroides cellulosolvens]KNY26565.1 Carbohydrate-binding CenC domain protein [Pseudobacteroides cellulosolvens ATCC 35603 = DSM 2933]